MFSSIMNFSLTYFKARFGLCGALMGYSWGHVGFKIVSWSTHVVEQLSFYLFLSSLTFDFDLILGSFLTFWGPNGLFLGFGYGSKTVLGSPNID